MQRLLVRGSKDRWMAVKCTRLRRMFEHGGTAALRIEAGRWNNLKREEMANPSRSCASVDSIISTNDLTHFCPFSVFMYGATWDSSPSVCRSHDALE